MIPIMTPPMSEPAKTITRDPQAFEHSEPASGLWIRVIRVHIKDRAVW
jgi:hypothetical protein